MSLRWASFPRSPSLARLRLPSSSLVDCSSSRRCEGESDYHRLPANRDGCQVSEARPTFALQATSEAALSRIRWSRRVKQERGHVSPPAPEHDWAGNRIPSCGDALCLKCPLPLHSARAPGNNRQEPRSRCSYAQTLRLHPAREARRLLMPDERLHGGAKRPRAAEGECPHAMLTLRHWSPLRERVTPASRLRRISAPALSLPDMTPRATSTPACHEVAP